jgi:site-specific recombinase XerD
MTQRSTQRADTALQLAVTEAWLSSRIAPNTRAAYRTDLETFRRWCAGRGSIPLRADATTMVAFQAARVAAGDSASTLRRRWSSLSSFYEFARQRNATVGNPVLEIVRPKATVGDPSPTVALSADAVAAYRTLAAALDPRLDALVSLLVADGLKLGEALAVDVTDLAGRPPRMSLIIRRRGVSKRIVLDPRSARAVRRCVGGRRDGPLFTSARTRSDSEPSRLSRFGADHLMRQLTADAQNRVTANELRRFHISADPEAARNLDRIRERAGLADVRSVRRYLLEPTDSSAGGNAAPVNR